jgi:hypothetical protein
VIARQGEEQKARQLLPHSRRQAPARRLPVAQVLEEQRRAASFLGFEPGSHRSVVIGARGVAAHP